MGYFDSIRVSKNHLPRELQNHEDGWQTKSITNTLLSYEIDSEGKIYLVEPQGRTQPKWAVNFTGSVTFYQDIDGVWYEMVAFFIKGKAFKFVSIEEKDAVYN